MIIEQAESFDYLPDQVFISHRPEIPSRIY